MMANIINQLLNENKSVLVTALTNRALIELASKEALDGHRSDKNIMKTNVSSDEVCSCKNLIPDSKDIASVKENLHLRLSTRQVPGLKLPQPTTRLSIMSLWTRRVRHCSP